MGSYRYEILRETTTDSLIMENNTREKKMNSNVYGIDLGTCNMKIYCKTSNKILWNWTSKYKGQMGIYKTSI